MSHPQLQKRKAKGFLIRKEKRGPHFGLLDDILIKVAYGNNCGISDDVLAGVAVLVSFCCIELLKVSFVVGTR